MIKAKEMSTDENNLHILYELTQIEHDQLKECLLDMLRDFIRICEKYSLCYMLGGGSALGAIRHKGFIPWDDDLDIMMPREDYNKFIKVFKQEMSEQYYLYVPNSEYDVSNTFMKIVKKDTNIIDIYNVKAPFYQGVWLDIFPIENTPSNKNIRKLKGVFLDIIAFIAVSVYMYKFRNPFMKNQFNRNSKQKIVYKSRLLIGALFGVIDYKTWYNQYDKIAQTNKEGNIWTIPTGRKHYSGETQEKSVFIPTQKSVFEGVEVNLPNDVDGYLKNLYGDYMKIPPVEKRERHFIIDFKIEDKNDIGEK